MGEFEVGKRFVKHLDQIVTVNGVRVDTLRCLSIKHGSGPGGTTAEFDLPYDKSDSYRGGIQDGLVCVYVLNAADRSQPSVPDFQGYLDTDKGELAPEQDEATISGRTITHYFSKIWVGQKDLEPVKTYVLRDPVTNKPTSWTPLRILQDLIANLPVEVAVLVKLGNVRVLETIPAENTPEIRFHLTTYANAIDQIVQLAGDVAWTERWDGFVTYLDFYRIGDTAAPVTAVRIAIGDDDEDENANVVQITNSVSSGDCISRVIAYGQPREFVVSCEWDTTLPEDMQLIPDWDPSLEPLVLKQPQRAKYGEPGFVPGMEYVFRRFKLPACFHGLVISKDLPVVRNNGERYNPQVYYYPTILEDEEGTGDKIGVEQTVPRLLPNAQFDFDKYSFTLAQPAINIARMSWDSVNNKPKNTYIDATVGITFAYQGKHIYHDTGHDWGSDVYLNFRAAGLTDSYMMDKVRWAQYTNKGFPVNGREFTTWIFNTDEYGSPATEITSPLKIIDETAILRRAALDQQRQKSRRHRTYQIEIGWFSRAYRVGSLCVVTGQDNYVSDAYMITGVDHDLVENTTTITLDNAKPPHRRTVGGR